METAKKQIPPSITKVKLCKYYDPMSELFIRTEINKIILKNRRTIEPFKSQTDKKIIATRFVLKVELMAFAEIYGLPEIYLNE